MVKSTDKNAPGSGPALDGKKGQSSRPQPYDGRPRYFASRWLATGVLDQLIDVVENDLTPDEQNSETTVLLAELTKAIRQWKDEASKHQEIGLRNQETFFLPTR